MPQYPRIDTIRDGSPSVCIHEGEESDANGSRGVLPDKFVSRIVSNFSEIVSYLGI